MLECPGCGARNSTSSSFCVRCGQALGTSAAPGASRAAGGRSILDEAAELYAAGRLNEAAAACRRALDADPDLVAARATLAMVEEDRGNLAAALAECEAVLRLAPERIAERERADRLRSRLASQVAPVFADQSPDPRRRWLPVAAAVLICVVVLAVGAAVISGGRKRAPQENFITQEQPRSYMPEASGGSSSPTVAELTAGGGPLAGRPIGNIPQDQSALQRPGDASLRAGTGPPDVPRAEVPVSPPPTVRDEDDGPLTPVAPSARGTGPLPAADGSRSAAGGSASPTRTPGKVRISVADPGGYPAPATTTGAAAPAAEVGADHGGRARTAGGLAAPPPLVGAPDYGRAAGGGFPRASVPSGGERSRSATPDYRPGGNAGSGGTAALAVAAAGGRSPSVTTGGPGPVGASRGVGARPAAPREGGHVAMRAGAPSSSHASRNAAGRSSADELRSEAQKAWATGRTDDARGLYRRAIESYRAEAGANPGRAAASRSAIESCERALEAMEASR